eukprot:3105369-Prymnesium_polylepis.2
MTADSGCRRVEAHESADEGSSAPPSTVLRLYRARWSGVARHWVMSVTPHSFGVTVIHSLTQYH